jgi:hypothetical protein
MAATPIPLSLSIAPFPEGFQGDMDETFQQATQLMSGTIQGNFLTGLILPPGSTLPTSDQGPIAMNETWYFWDPTSGQYLPQTVTVKPAKNFARNPVYQVAQQGLAFTIGAGGGNSTPVTQTYDMCLCRSVTANVLAISQVGGPPAGPNNDAITTAMNYTVGPTLVPTPGATDLYAHEHLIEGSDIVMLQGQVLTLSFFVWINQAGTYSAYLTNGGRDRSYVFSFTITAAQASTWVRVVVPSIPPFPSSGTWNYSEGLTGLYLGVPMCVGTQWQTAALNSWQSAFFAGSAQNTNLLTVVNNRLSVTGIKLEAATAATYLQVPSFQNDFEDMQRYFYTTFNYQAINAGVSTMGIAYVAAGAILSLLFPRRMCKVPAVVPYSSSTFASANIRNQSTNADVAVATLAATPKGIYAAPTVTGAAVGNVVTCLVRADARLT